MNFLSSDDLIELVPACGKGYGDSAGYLAWSIILDCSFRFSRRSLSTRRTNRDGASAQSVKACINTEDCVSHSKLRLHRSFSAPLWAISGNSRPIQPYECFLKTSSSYTNPVWKISKRASFAAFVTDASIRSKYNRLSSSFPISGMIAGIFLEIREERDVGSRGPMFCTRPLKLIANASSRVATVCGSCISIPEFLYTIRNHGFFPPRRIYSGLVAIVVGISLLQIDFLMRISLILSMFVLHVELIGEFTFVFSILCLSAAF